MARPAWSTRYRRAWASLRDRGLIARRVACLLALFLAAALAPAQPAPAAQPAPTEAPAAPPSVAGDVLRPRQLGLVINDDDPDSVAIGAYYRRQRGVPAANVVHVRLPKSASIDLARFRLLKAEIDGQLGPDVQAVLLVWTAPYKVACNAITAAYTLGFDDTLCRDTCRASQPSSYFNAAGRRPFGSYGMRLSMLLPIATREAARALVDRGIASDGRAPPASAWYLTTSEAARNSRAVFFPRPGYLAAKNLRVHRLSADALENVDDVLVYQIGKAEVAKLGSLHFVPGALADHLTSHGGELLGGTQMSSLRWLEAGATASYGTVSEPCNYWQKFPNPAVLLRHYLDGDTAIEAYWKSVAWPAQGLFIGEPLAAPYCRAGPDIERTTYRPLHARSLNAGD